MAAHPTDPNLFFGGTQDNGITLRLGNSLEWRQALGGDAGFTGFDPVEPSTMYAAFTIPLRSDDGGLSWTTKTNGLCVAPCNALDSSQPFVPMAIDHASPGTLYLGTYRLWKTTDRGDNWFLPSPGLSLPGANCAPRLQSLHQEGGLSMLEPSSASCLFQPTEAPISVKEIHFYPATS